MRDDVKKGKGRNDSHLDGHKISSGGESQGVGRPGACQPEQSPGVPPSLLSVVWWRVRELLFTFLMLFTL